MADLLLGDRLLKTNNVPGGHCASGLDKPLPLPHAPGTARSFRSWLSMVAASQKPAVCDGEELAGNHHRCAEEVVVYK